MVHKTVPQRKKYDPTSVKSYIGIWMFFTYTVVYAGFIIINVIKPEIMSRDAGSNTLAVVYGLGLIVFAVFLALIYNHLCKRVEKKGDKISDNKEGGVGQ
jgi:uncharacterized membrane protein (DUF485 family)